MFCGRKERGGNGIAFFLQKKSWILFFVIVQSHSQCNTPQSVIRGGGSKAAPILTRVLANRTAPIPFHLLFDYKSLTCCRLLKWRVKSEMACISVIFINKESFAKSMVVKERIPKIF